MRRSVRRNDGFWPRPRRAHSCYSPERAFRRDEFVKKSGGIVGEAQSRELPAIVRIKEVAIGNTAMPVWSCKRGAAQHQLVDHELAVILAERALDGAVTGIGGIGAAGPLPDNPERVVELGEIGRAH